MHHEAHDVAGKFRSEAHRCWKNATAMYCRASAGRDADTRGLYIQMAVCWAALAAELEKRISLTYAESASRHYPMSRDGRWPTAAEEPPALAAAAPRSGS
jgi:hypothetical protein